VNVFEFLILVKLDTGGLEPLGLVPVVRQVHAVFELEAAFLPFPRRGNFPRPLETRVLTPYNRHLN
jgi:hypothetical protein